MIRHLEYWTSRLGSYALVHLTSELIGKERRLLAEKPTHKGASNLELATAMGHRTLNMLQHYTHLDVQVTRRFSKNISEQILQGIST